jgi:2,4-dienoyl-CoA reductase-like NADH-dependent reductase (Old Yellow Enzyme family)
MGTQMPEADGSVSEKLINYLTMFAKGGAGLVITEGAPIDDKESRLLPSAF